MELEKDEWGMEEQEDELKQISESIAKEEPQVPEQQSKQKEMLEDISTERVSLRINGFELDIGSAYMKAEGLVQIAYTYYMDWLTKIKNDKERIGVT